MAITITETATNVIISFVGSLNTAASTPGAQTNCPTDDGFVGDEDVCVGNSVPDVLPYNIAGPNNLGLGPGANPPEIADSSAGGSQIAVRVVNPLDPLTFQVAIDVGYTSGTMVSGSSTYNGQTLASMNIGNTGLVATWTLLDSFGGVPLAGPGSTITLTVIPLGGGGFGDPHLKTWNGQVYDYHGECDLVLASSKVFANGLGLDIHIRTTIRDDWSFISAAALRIGEEILEVQSFHKHYLNGVENAPLPKQWTAGGFRTKHMVSKRKNQPERFIVYIGPGRIEMRVYRDFVAVYIENPLEEHFGDAVGLMGNFKTSKWLLRDGESVTKDPIAFGNEWQVQEHEHKLFMEEGSVTYPETCRLPSQPTEEERRHRRLTESSHITVEMAEEACKDWIQDKEFCVEDVLLTGDIDIAISGVGAY